jgi:chemotaxis protein MotB
MPLQTSQAVIIIKKARRGHGGHHGGAWKVAYADFVTAMLSLFIVLWLLSSSETVKKAVGGYFSDPTGQGKEVGNGLKGAGSEALSIKKDDMNQLKDKLEEAIKSSSSFQKIKEHVIFTVTGEGLRVELLEGEYSTFFETGNSRPTESGKDLLGRLAEEIGRLPNKVVLEGHTDSRLFHGAENYSNWELSADRANSARRWMQASGMRTDQVIQVRGFADQSLRDPAHPDDGSNRRVTMVIMYQPPKADDGAPQPGASAGGKPATPATGSASPVKALAKTPPVAKAPPAKTTATAPAKHWFWPWRH